MRVTFDTNVLLSATLWEGSVAQKLLFDLIRKEVKIYSTKEIISEYQKVLTRDFAFSDEEIQKIMGKIFLFITFVKPTLKVNIVDNDPDDNKIVECALASKSDYIITYDLHLLTLNEYKSIKIIKPEEARRMLQFF